MILENSDQERIEEDSFIFPASFAQQRLWFIEQLLPSNTLYTIPLLFRLTGTLDHSKLQSSIQSLTHRHEILRTTFEVLEGQLVQAIAPALPLSLDVVDLRTIPEGDREAIAIQQIRQNIQHPFSLDTGPLFRARVWRLGEAEHLLSITLHHIIFDEWSSGVLIRELGERYAALVDGRPDPLPDMPIQYADFAHWQREWLQGDVLATQLHYWKQQLQDVPVLSLPGVVHRPNRQGHDGASLLLELPQDLLNGLEALSQRRGVTLFMTLLATFQTLLHRYTGQTDIVIGSPIANRHHSQLEGLIGFLVNSLVLRTNLTGDPSFHELLDRVREVTLAAYAHQDLPFERLVEELQPVRNLGQNPLFQVVFALQNAPMEQLTLPGLLLSPLELETKTARFDLEIYLWTCADNFRNLWGDGWQHLDGLRGVIVYNTALFDADTIASLRHQFQTLLEGIVAAPETPLSELPLLTLTEQQILLQQWANTQTHYPDQACIHQLLEAQAQKQPDAIAIQFSHQTFSYAQLNQGSNQLARYLRRLGVGSEMTVGVCLEQSAEAIAAMLAILKAGGAYVPLDPTYPPERLQFMVEDADITVILTQAPWADALQKGNVTLVCLEQEWNAIAQESNQNLSLSCTADQLAYIIYTSGSTGKPKGVMVPHRAVSRLVCATNYVHIETGDRVAQVANLAFDAATFEIWGALLNGAQLVGMERETTLTPSDFAAELRQQQISILFLTTALLNQTVSQVPTAFQSLKYLLFGGETVNVDRVRTILLQGKPQHLLHVYGPTENTTFSTWYEVEHVPQEATTIPIGRAIANTQVYVLDTHLNPVPANVVGEIYLGGDGLARGYLGHGELTTERFIANPFAANSAIGNPLVLYKTGDRALYRSDGQVEFLGRADDQVKIRGFRVELGEVEAAIAQHPAIQMVAVIVRDIEQNRQLVAYVVPHGIGEALTERDLRAFLKAKIPIYMVPAAFVILNSLPLTANGKVNQKALPPPELGAISEHSRQVAPNTSIEVVLIELWSQLLGRSQVGIHDNFFELGGHSLLATQLVSRIRDRFQVELPLRQVFELPTVAELAHVIALSGQDGGRTGATLNGNRTESGSPLREEIEL